MNALVTAVKEIWGLFVEDASFTVGILVCIVIAIYVLPSVGLAPYWRGPLLFIALAIVLIENVARSARR